ncbi:MAG TPA: CHASE domain-containing protein, partial [Pseudorhodoferax sp.]|nr:CHASE domain-containing protein [Pseudorhodoferax sp.]
MRKSYFPWIWALALFAAGCVAASLATGRLAAVQRQQKEARFEEVTDAAVQNVLDRIHVYEYGLRGARGALVAVGPDQATRRRFRNYAMSRILEHEFPGARGFGFIRRVPQPELEAFTRRARADENPTFAVRQLALHDDDLLVIEYIEPEASNQEAIGLDVASEVRRRSAAHEALRSGTPTLSRPITLVQASGQPEQGLLFLIPLYQPDAQVATPEERWQASVGLVYAPLVIDEILASMDMRHSELAFALLDADAQKTPQRFYAGAGWEEPAADGLQRRVQLSLYGRQWLVEFKAMPSFVASLGLIDPKTALQSGVATSGVLAILLYMGLLSIQQRRQAALDNARMAAIAESVSDGIVGLDAQQRVMSWNRAAEQIFGRTAAEALGRPFRELLPADAGVDTVTRLKIVRPGDGEELDLDLTRAPVRAHGGGVLGTAVTVRDVTVQQSADERFRLAVDAAPTAMLMVDSDQRVVLANRKAEDLFGYRETQLLGMPIDTLVPGRYRSRHAHDFSQYMQQPRARPMGQGRPLFALHKNGREIPVEIGLSPVRTRHGLTALATITDVSQRWALEMQLQATLQRLQMAVGMAGLGVWVRRLVDDQMIWDERMYTIYGVPPAQREHVRCMDLWSARVHPEDRAMVEDSLQRHLDNEAPFDPVFRIRLASGELRYIQAAAIVERTAHGEPVQIVGINRDITDQKSAETRILELNSSLEDQVERRTQQLHEALLAAETATRAKSEFLANMSHEIRSPMNAILGLCYLLERELLPAASRDMVLRIQGAGRALLGIINDILDLSKIEAHRLDLERTPFHLSEVLDNLASIMASSLGDKPVELVVGPAPAGAEHLVGDSLRLSQVLVNLASNAIKFTAQGEVVVHIDRVDDGAVPERVTLRFTVRDTGVGIPIDKQAGFEVVVVEADAEG